MATGISPEYKRDLKRLFNKNEGIALLIHKGSQTEREQAIEQVAELTGLSLIVLQLNMREIQNLSFTI